MIELYLLLILLENLADTRINLTSINFYNIKHTFMNMFHMRAIILLTMLVLFVSALAAAQSTNQTGSTVTIGLVAKNIRFNVSSITVPAGSNVVINFDNQDNGVPHNFAVYTNSSATSTIFRGPIITGPNMTTYTFTAPITPGTYFFRCDVHPTQMYGQFIVSSMGTASTPSAAAPSNVSMAGPANMTSNVTTNVTSSITKITVTNTTNATQPSAPYAPGFESIFAITGLLAAAYLVLGRKR